MQYVLNRQNPVCCEAYNRSVEYCFNNKSDYCLDWQCLDLVGCTYFTRDCETDPFVIANDYLSKRGDCQTLTCNNASGCYLATISGKQLDKCSFCEGDSSSPCSSLSTSEIVAISGGVLAAIIIAVIVICLICGAVGGKVGLDYYRKYKGRMNNLQSNPLYEDKQKGGVNPFYQESEMTSK